MKNIIKITLLLIICSLFGLSCSNSKIHLASDAKTGQYLGVVMTETRDFESKEILFYEIANDKQSFQKSQKK